MFAPMWSKLKLVSGYARDFGLVGAFHLATRYRRRQGLIRLKHPAFRSPVYLRRHGSDYSVMRQILFRGESFYRLKRPPSVIIDGGANVGYSALLYARCYRDCTVLAVEPDAENCAIIRKNCAAYPQIKLIEAALWPRRCQLWIENPADESWAFRMTEQPVGSSTGIPAVTIAGLLDAYGFATADLVKLDIEGAEKELFEQNSAEWLSRVRVLMVELHDRFKPGCREALERAVRDLPHRLSHRGEYVVVEFEHQPAPTAVGTCARP